MRFLIAVPVTCTALLAGQAVAQEIVSRDAPLRAALSASAGAPLGLMNAYAPTFGVVALAMFARR